MNRKNAKTAAVCVDYLGMVFCCWLTVRFPNSNWAIAVTALSMANVVHSLVSYVKEFGS